jgi:hypothetical protein
MLSGFYGGIVDAVLNVYVTNAFLALPGILLAIAFVAFLGPGRLPLTVGAVAASLPFMQSSSHSARGEALAYFEVRGAFRGAGGCLRCLWRCCPVGYTEIWKTCAKRINLAMSAPDDRS